MTALTPPAATPAEELRAAAATIRTRARAVLAGAAESGSEWYDAHELSLLLDEGMGDRDADAAHIVTWSPEVALAVAAWLEQTAERVAVGQARPSAVYAALTVARTIGGRP